MRDVYSGINARLCAYYTQSMGIDTPLQNMHDDKVYKVEMWIVVQEVRGASVGGGHGSGVWCSSFRGWCFLGDSKY